MNITEKRALFKALRSIKRLEGKAASTTTETKIGDLQKFTERAWQALVRPEKMKTAATKLYRHIAALATDEEEANEEEVIFNYYLYAAADLAKYFAEADEAYLESPREWEIEQARFIATQNFLSNIAGACVLTPDQIQQIESSELIAHVIKAQNEDEILAEEIND